MNAQVDKQIGEAEGKLIALLGEAKDTPGLFPRVEAWIAKMTGGRKLSAYLHDAAVPPKDRITVGKTLVDILLAKDYGRLPEVGADAKVEADFAAMQVARDNEAAEGRRVAQVEAEEKRRVAAEEADALPPAPDELRAQIRAEVRKELAAVLQTIAKVLRED